MKTALIYAITAFACVYWFDKGCTERTKISKGVQVKGMK